MSFKKKVAEAIEKALLTGDDLNQQKFEAEMQRQAEEAAKKQQEGKS